MPKRQVPSAVYKSANQLPLNQSQSTRSHVIPCRLLRLGLGTMIHYQKMRETSLRPNVKPIGVCWNWGVLPNTYWVSDVWMSICPPWHPLQSCLSPEASRRWVGYAVSSSSCQIAEMFKNPLTTLSIIVHYCDVWYLLSEASIADTQPNFAGT